MIMSEIYMGDVPCMILLSDTATGALGVSSVIVLFAFYLSSAFFWNHVLLPCCSRWGPLNPSLPPPYP